jgi:TetR/AcrR family transcriptional regulator, transcriptional repressor for nem operon
MRAASQKPWPPVDQEVDDERDKLAAYAGLYGDVLRGKRMCLCGMLAAEYETLPEPMRQMVVRFFDENEAWLEGVLEQGRRRGRFHFEGEARDAARLIVSGLEGAMLVARPYGDLARFQAAADLLLAALVAGVAAPAAN